MEGRTGGDARSGHEVEPRRAHDGGTADLETLGNVVGRVRANVERVIEGKPDVVSSAARGAARRGAPADRGRARASARPCSARRWPGASTARCAGSSSRPTCCPPTSPASRCSTRTPVSSSSAPAAIFANIVVGDEINRASPKTQSALLECMEEHQVTVDNTTYHLESPFMVIATQNPIEMEGTYALPEAQRDRFMARVSVGYPVEAAEIAMLNSHTRSNPLDDLEPVTDAAEIRKLSGIVSQVYVSEAVQKYAVALTSATRQLERPDARRLAPRHAPPGARRQGPGRDGRSRLRAARRPPLAGAAGALPPAAAQRRGRHERPLDHRHPRRPSSPRCRCRVALPCREPAAVTAADRRRSTVREALAGLTVRGRAFLAAGITAIVCAVVMGQQQLTRVGVLVAVLPLLAARTDRPQPLPALAGPDGHPAAGDGRLAGPGHPGAHQRGSYAERRAHARGPRALRARHPPPLRPRGDRQRLAPRGDLPDPLRRPRAVRHRPDDGAGERPVRPGRARPLLPHHRPDHRHPPHRPPPPGPARRRLDGLG